MKTTLDVAAALGACIWPMVTLVILLAYRKEIPALVKALASRVTKLEFASAAVELAVARPFVPE